MSDLLPLIYFKITWALSTLLEHMQKRFEINRTKIKGGCQSGRKVVTHDSKSDLPLVCTYVRFQFWNLLSDGWFKLWSSRPDDKNSNCSDKLKFGPNLAVTETFAILLFILLWIYDIHNNNNRCTWLLRKMHSNDHKVSRYWYNLSHRFIIAS